MLVLRAIALIFVGRTIGIGGIAADAVAAAQRQAGEGAPGFIAAIGKVALASQRAAAQIIGRIGGEGFHSAAQRIGRLGADGAGPLRNAHIADIFRTDGAGDVQAIMVAIAHVAQRNAVEGEAELILVEAADGDALRPFIIAERISRLEIDAGQLFDGLQRVGAGRQRDDVLRLDFLNLTGFAPAEDDDVRIFGCCFRR